MHHWRTWKAHGKHGDPFLKVQFLGKPKLTPVVLRVFRPSHVRDLPSRCHHALAVDSVLIPESRGHREFHTCSNIVKEYVDVPCARKLNLDIPVFLPMGKIQNYIKQERLIIVVLPLPMAVLTWVVDFGSYGRPTAPVTVQRWNSAPMDEPCGSSELANPGNKNQFHSPRGLSNLCR